jgi:adenosylcobinamide-phosphate synthase
VGEWLVPCIALLVALAIDRLLGEPPLAFHPVAWMGHWLGEAGNWLKKWANPDPAQADWKTFWVAAVQWCAFAAAIGFAAWLVQAIVLLLPWYLGAPLLGVLLKPLMAWRMLRNEVLAVEEGLAESLVEGRLRLARLVSRDVSQLTETQVRESAIESLSENLNDSVVAPVFWFVLFGLPGAAIYRFANTADAMWGYRGLRNGQNWEWAGKWAARADDVLSWVPARITALLLALVTGGRRVRALPREAARTPSPNSGWPMAAMALALNVQLSKPGVYTLHEAGAQARPADMARAVRIATRSLVTLAAVACAALFLLARGMN